MTPVISRTLPCALDITRLRIILRDLARRINYDSPSQPIAYLSAPEELWVTQGWIGLPPWVKWTRLRLEEHGMILIMALETDLPQAAVAALADSVVRDLTEYLCYPVIPYGKRVFGLGWSKSGTTSLTLAMRRLGIFSWRLAPWMAGFYHAHSETACGEPDWSALDDYEFCADLPLSLYYRELDERYPGSLFILTTRPVDDWLPLGRDAIEKDIASFGKLPGMGQWAYNANSLDEIPFRERFLRHQRDILDYFGDHSDLLVIDLNDGDPWPTLCGFLGLPIPNPTLDLTVAWRNIRTAL